MSVSVSAMTPCIVLVFSVPLHMFYKKVLSIMTKSERFEKVWQSYIVSLKTNPNASFAAHVRNSHVSVGYMRNWIYEHGLSITGAKALARACQIEEKLKSLPSVVSEDNEPAMFAPVTVSRGKIKPEEMLFGISVTLPGGTVVSVKQGSAEAIVSFISHYVEKEVPCLD